MTAQPHDEHGVIAINDALDDLVPLDEWLALVSSDEPVTLTQSELPPYASGSIVPGNSWRWARFHAAASSSACERDGFQIRDVAA